MFFTTNFYNYPTRTDPSHKGPLMTRPANDPLKCDPTLDPLGRTAR